MIWIKLNLRDTHSLNFDRCQFAYFQVLTSNSTEIENINRSIKFNMHSLLTGLLVIVSSPLLLVDFYSLALMIWCGFPRISKRRGGEFIELVRFATTRNIFGLIIYSKFRNVFTGQPLLIKRHFLEEPNKNLDSFNLFMGNLQRSSLPF